MLLRFLVGQGYDVGPIELYQDNMSTIALLNKGRSTSDRTRHVDIRYFWLSERINNGEITLSHMPAVHIGRANVLTKPLQGQQFFKERGELLGIRGAAQPQ